MKKMEIIVEKTNTGYSAYAEKIPVYTVGDTLEELKTNILKVLNLYFENLGGAVVTENVISFINA